jgi:hypothetical protein
MSHTLFTPKLSAPSQETLQALYEFELSPLEQKIADALSAELAFKFVTAGFVDTLGDPRLPLTRRHLRHMYLQESSGQHDRDEQLTPLFKWSALFRKTSFLSGSRLRLDALPKCVAAGLAAFAVTWGFFYWVYSAIPASPLRSSTFILVWDLILGLILSGWMTFILLPLIIIPGVLRLFFSRGVPKQAQPSPYQLIFPKKMMRLMATNPYLNKTVGLPGIREEYAHFLPIPAPVSPGGFLNKMTRTAVNPSDPYELVDGLLQHLSTLPQDPSVSSRSKYADIDAIATHFDSFVRTDRGRAFLAHVQKKRLSSRHGESMISEMPVAL